MRVTTMLLESRIDELPKVRRAKASDCRLDISSP
jgi:hypothetical protein